jgi:hypothetical protein
MTKNHATVSINRRRQINRRRDLSSIPTKIVREDLFCANYTPLEQELEKEVGSISTMNHDKIMIVHKGANHGIGTFEKSPQKA